MTNLTTILPLTRKTDFHPARACDAESLARNVRRQDLLELTACGYHDISDALTNFYRQSVLSYVLYYGGKPAAIWGIVPQNYLGNRACVWLITSEELPRCAKTFMRKSRQLLDEALRHYPVLFNWVDSRYAGAIRLIEKLGGSFNGECRYENGIKFLFFTFRRKEKWEE